MYLSFDVFDEEPLQFDPGNIMYRVYMTDEDQALLGQYIGCHALIEYAATCWHVHFGLASADRVSILWWKRISDVDSSRFMTWFQLNQIHHWASPRSDDIQLLQPGVTRLTMAAYLGHNAMIVHLVDDGNLNSMDGKGRTAFWWATEEQHLPIVQQLVNAGAAHTADGEGITPLMVASRRSRKRFPALEENALVHEFVEYGANSDFRDKHGSTALSLAAMTGQVRAVRLLVCAGASYYIADNHGQVPLYHAAFDGNEPIVKFLLETAKGEETDSEYESCDTPLWSTKNVSTGETAVGCGPVKRSARIDWKNKDERTCLSLACESGHSNIVGLLLNHGASVTLVDRKGRSPLAYAASCTRKYYQCIDIVRMLLKKGA